MRTLVIYYSYSGTAKAVAEELATKESADIIEVKDVKRPGTLKAYTLGCFAAMKGKAWPISPSNIDLEKYDKITLIAT